MRILAVIQNNLLGEVLDSLLGGAYVLRIQQVYQLSMDSLWLTLSQHKPEVLLLEEGLLDETTFAFADSVPDNSPMRIITISVHDNRVHVYDTFQTSLTQASDFVQLIENRPRYLGWSQ